MDVDAPRRSLRKREEKSYTETPDFIIEEDLGRKGRQLGKSALATHTNNSNSTEDRSAAAGPGNSTTNALSNGDVVMESDDDDDGPLEPLPLPKV